MSTPDSENRLRTALLEAEENTRAAISREIHDHFGQKLTASRQLISALKRDLDRTDRQSPVDHASISESVLLLDAMIGDLQISLKSFLRELWPEALGTFGIDRALNELIHEVTGSSPHLSLTYDADIDVQRTRFEQIVELTVFRFVQEALSNVLQHAHARHCRVMLSVQRKDDPMLLIASVEDDGLGIAASSRSEGRGLIGMQDRASALGGRFRKHATDAGTTVRIELPVVQLNALNDRA